jgi:NNP family nitrate/nitrite transporter-like MFS transporter
MATFRRGTIAGRLPRRAIATVAVATVGLGLNLRAWILLGSQLHDRFQLDPTSHILLVGVPLVVAALVRLPVGILTDKYGARVMFPAVSLATAISVFAVARADSLLSVVIAGGAAGIGGAAFVVGGALLSRTLRYGRRGLALGVFSLAPAFGVVVSAVSRGLDVDGRRAALVLAGLLVGFAALAALVLRDHPSAQRVDSSWRRCVDMARLAVRSSLSLLYAVALGGIVAIAVYLPIYLATAFGVEWFRALAITGIMVGLAAVARLVGGWWSDRHPTVGVLKICYAVAAGLCLVLAVLPQLWWITAPIIAIIAVCDGLASGALLGLIGKQSFKHSVGAIMGVTSAAAALGAVLLPLILAGVDYISHSYAAAWALLGAALLAVALHVRAKGLHVGLGLPVPPELASGTPAMTIMVVDQSETRFGASAIVSRLAQLAATDELVVVYGSDEPPRPHPNVLVAGLRYCLPRFCVVALDSRHSIWSPELLGEFAEAGTVTITATPSADLGRVAAELTSYLRADRLLMMSYTLTHGANLHQVWRRRYPAMNGN